MKIIIIIIIIIAVSFWKRRTLMKIDRCLTWLDLKSGKTQLKLVWNRAAAIPNHRKTSKIRHTRIKALIIAAIHSHEDPSRLLRPNLAIVTNGAAESNNTAMLAREPTRRRLEVKTLWIPARKLQLLLSVSPERTVWTIVRLILRRNWHNAWEISCRVIDQSRTLGNPISRPSIDPKVHANSLHSHC